jgi:hypothetical protein
MANILDYPEQSKSRTLIYEKRFSDYAEERRLAFRDRFTPEEQEKADALIANIISDPTSLNDSHAWVGEVHLRFYPHKPPAIGIRHDFDVALCMTDPDSRRAIQEILTDLWEQGLKKFYRPNP